MDIEKHTFGMGDRFAHQGRAQLQALEEYEAIIARNVTANLFARHIKPIFG